HHGGARARQALEFRLAIPGEEIEMDRIELRPRLLTPLEEEARAASVGIPSHVEGFELALVHPGGEKRLEKPLVDRLVRPPEGVGPEASERDGSRAREGHVAEVTVGQRVRGRLDAEAVSLRIAHDSACLFDLADATRFRLDEPPAETEQPFELRLAVGDVDVEMDRKLDRRGLRHSGEPEFGPVAACKPIGVAATLAAIAAEKPGPELANALRILASEGHVVQAQQRPFPFMYTRAHPHPGWG